MLGLRTLRSVVRFASHLRSAEPTARVDVETAAPAARPERDRVAEMFELVRKMEAQRDDWKARFMEQWHQHQNAQAELETHIQAIGTTLVHTVNVLNAMRKQHDLEPLTVAGARDLAMRGEKVLKSSAQYGEAMRALELRAPKRDAFGQIVGWSSEPAERDLNAAEAATSIVEDAPANR